MSDGVSFPFDIDADSAQDTLGDIFQALDDIEGELKGLGDIAAFDELKKGVSSVLDETMKLDNSLDTLTQGLDGVEKADPFDKIKSSISKTIKPTDSLFTSFKKGFVATSKQSDSFVKSFKGGVLGVFDNAGKKAKKFKDDVSDVFTKIRHPIKAFKDHVTETFKSAGESGKEFTDETQNNVEDTTSKLEKFIGTIQKIAIVAGAVKVFGSILNAIKDKVIDAVKASERLEQATKFVGAAFGDNADNVNEWSKNFSSAIHRSEAEVKSFMTSNKSMFDSMDMSDDLALDMSKMTTSITYDVAREFKVDDADVLADMQDAFGGNEDALNKYGIKLDEVTLKEHALKLGVQGSFESLDEATQAQIRMNAILEQTDELHGKAANSIGGFSGGMKAMQAAGENLLAKVGDKFGPVFDKAFGVILDLIPKVEPMIMQLADMVVASMDSFIPIIADLAEQLLPVLFDAFEQILPPIMQLASDVLPIFSDILLMLIPPIAEIASALLPILAQIIGTVSKALLPLIEVFMSFLDAILKPLMPLIQMLVDTLLPPLAKMFEGIAPIIELLLPPFEFLVGILEKVVGWIGKLIGAVGDFLASGIEKIGDFFGGLFGGGGSSSSVPGNALGTDDFEGGLTKINEVGGEIIQAGSTDFAMLPKHSTIIPADKSGVLMDAIDQMGNLASDMSGPNLQSPSMFFMQAGKAEDNTSSDERVSKSSGESIKRLIIELVGKDIDGNENFDDDFWIKLRAVIKEIVQELNDEETDISTIQLALQ